MLSVTVTRQLVDEASALQVRLDSLRSFSETMPRVAAAEVAVETLSAVEAYLSKSRLSLRHRVAGYLNWLRQANARATAQQARSRLTMLRLKYTSLLGQLDIFADALTQRSEHEHGIWLAGLDAVSRDALRVRGVPRELPPLMTYLDRGHGAAIRRVRTRLPGGGENPVSIIRVPRERMVGSGIAASLVHEVGHQGAALLDLVATLRHELNDRIAQAPAESQPAWRMWERWISEIIADTWALGLLGISASMGVMSVLCLPRAFIFRFNMDDPHPFPWIRLKLSIAMGNHLFPDPQWEALDHVWESYYPLDQLPSQKQAVIRLLVHTMDDFIKLLVNHRTKALGGRTLRSIFPIQHRQPQQLRNLFQGWGTSLHLMRSQPPTLVLAVLGQAKHDGLINAQREGAMMEKLLRHWALAQTNRSARDRSHLNKE